MIELLAPAGYWDAMVAAVQNGADSVYLGCGDWNARRGAKNFTAEELPDAAAYCRLRGVKLYLTLNTLLSDRELTETEKLLRLASRCGVDAVIVQDWGAAALAKSIVPDLPLHGSTQMTVHSLAGVRRAAELGMECVVLGRELNRDNVRFICQNSPVPIEIFGHGALCMCWSGQCAMSAMIGGRSGNRGLCAQPCRLPYGMDGGKMNHPLSLKDASLAGHIPELTDMGVSVLKLEGRMKRAEYVAVVTRIYAALIRENRTATVEELRQLTLAFSRDGFTDGYWQGKTGRNMFGTRAENEPEPTELFREAKAAYERENMRTVPVRLEAEIREGRPAQLEASDDSGHTICVQGAVPEKAWNKPLAADELKGRLGKSGGTVFRAEAISVVLDEGLSLPASAVNGLRRDVLERLADLRAEPPWRQEAQTLPIDREKYEPKELAFTISLSNGRQLTPELINLHPAVVYLPAERIAEFDLSIYSREEVVFCAALPRVCTDSETPELLTLLKTAKQKGCTAAAIHNIGQIEIARNLGLSMRGDFGLNVFNSRSILELKSWGMDCATVSFELRQQQIRDLLKTLPCEAIVYGRLPLMLTENCLVSNALSCKEKSLYGACRKVHELFDRKGERFPILSVFGCRNELQNSKPLYLADKPEYQRCGLAYGRLRFTIESPAECVSVFRSYLEQRTDQPESFTRGLFFRGVQ